MDRQEVFFANAKNGVLSVKTRKERGLGRSRNVTVPGSTGCRRVLGHPFDVSVEERSRATEAVLLELFPFHQGENAVSRHSEPFGGLVDGDPKTNWCRQSHAFHAPSIASTSAVGNTRNPAMHRCPTLRRVERLT